jgi:site-specific recombinase XerD
VTAAIELTRTREDLDYITEDVLEALPAGERVRLMTISHAVDLWLGELERKNHSERTVDTYRRLLDRLSDGRERIDVEDVDAQTIRRFLDEQARLKNGGRKSAATIAQNVSIVCGFFDWLTKEGVVQRNPTQRNGDRIISRPRQVAPDENDNVTTVGEADVLRLLKTSIRMAAAKPTHWNRMIAVHALVYLGPRRTAMSSTRISDYDPDERMVTFHEKGGKTIRKPVPDDLAVIIDQAIADGRYPNPDDYLIPSDYSPRREGDRDSRVIWRLVKDVAGKAGVETHVHALRAAFAVNYLQQNPGQVVALQKLMGHRRIETTMVYLRRLDRQAQMESVRTMTWGASEKPQIASKPLVSSAVAEKEGFEPSFSARRDRSGAGTHSAPDAPGRDGF